MRLYLVIWRSTNAPVGERVTAVAADQALSEQELRVRIARREGLALPTAVLIGTVTEL